MTMFIVQRKQKVLIRFKGFQSNFNIPSSILKKMSWNSFVSEEDVGNFMESTQIIESDVLTTIICSRSRPSRSPDKSAFGADAQLLITF